MKEEGEARQNGGSATDERDRGEEMRHHISCDARRITMDEASLSSDCDAANLDSPKSRSCAVYGDRSSGISRFLNSQSSSESDSYKHELSPNLHDSAVVKDSSFPSHDSDSCGEREESSNGAISLQGSGNGSRSNVKLEDNEKGCDLKRKQDQSEGSAETRTTKFRRSSAPVENKTQQNLVVDDDDEKKARLMRNRETIGCWWDVPSSATCSWMYPHAAHMAFMPYTWMPCAPYVVKPQGSQVPLVPIPKLKPQQPASSKSKKSEGNKSEVKTKKVASISL
ncbi:hypothetical protein HN51_004679 [Arachis hypogaea]